MIDGPLPMLMYLDRPVAEKTVALPGTPEKLRVMMDRVNRGYSAFHPDDPVIEHKMGVVKGSYRSEWRPTVRLWLGAFDDE